MTLRERLFALAGIIADEAEQNAGFGKRVAEVLGGGEMDGSVTSHANGRMGGREERKTRPNRRAPAVLDPITLAAEGEGAVRSGLATLSIEQLKDIVAEYGMDPGKLVMKWKTPEKIIDRITEVSLARARKGDAFRP